MSELMCSVCAGEGKPGSGLPCICGGAGTQSAELEGFRDALYTAENKLHKAKFALTKIQYWLRENSTNYPISEVISEVFEELDR